MTRRNEGFATVAAIGLCAGLSVVAIAMLHMTQAGRDRVEQEVLREGQEQAIRSAIAIEIAELVSAPRVVPTTTSKGVGGWTVEVTTSNEQSKPNLLSADISLVQQALSDIGVPDARVISQRIASFRESNPEFRMLALEDAVTAAGLSEDYIDCVSDVLTVYGSSLDPVASGQQGPIDGAILNVRARVVAPQASDIVRERVFVVTGDTAAPLLELSDRRFRASLRQECKREK